MVGKPLVVRLFASQAAGMCDSCHMLISNRSQSNDNPLLRSVPPLTLVHKGAAARRAALAHVELQRNERRLRRLHIRNTVQYSIVCLSSINTSNWCDASPASAVQHQREQSVEIGRTPSLMYAVRHTPQQAHSSKAKGEQLETCSLGDVDVLPHDRRAGRGVQNI